jgi:hypothetical protein
MSCCIWLTVAISSFTFASVADRCSSFSFWACTWQAVLSLYDHQQMLMSAGPSHGCASSFLTLWLFCGSCLYMLESNAP